MTNTKFHMDHRALIEVGGEEAASFLNRVLTCKTEGIEPGEAIFGALPTPQGKILSDLFYLQGENSAYLDLPAKAADQIVQRLSLLKLRADVSFSFRTDLTLILTDGVEELPECETFRDKRLPDSWYKCVLPAERLEAGMEPAHTSMAYHHLRFESGLPEFGYDYEGSEVFPADVNLDLLEGVDFQKGCFIGQEVVSRMKRKTEVRKRTLRLESDKKDVPKGSQITADGSTLGQVTSWSEGCGLALIRIDRLKTAQDKGHVPELLNGPVSILALETN